MKSEMKTAIKWEGIWAFQHIRNGKVIWEQNIKVENLFNALVDEGESNILDTYFLNTNAPTQFYLGLASGSVSETDGLVDLPGEPSGNGYVRQLIERSSVGFPTKELHEGDWRVVSKQVTFTASGGSIGPVNVAFLGTTLDNSGLLIAFTSLSLERTILEGDSLVGQIKIKIK